VPSKERTLLLVCIKKEKVKTQRKERDENRGAEGGKGGYFRGNRGLKGLVKELAFLSSFCVS
jgi:hypothetical protein